MGKGEQGDLRCVLTSDRDGRRWPDLKKLVMAVTADCSSGSHRRPATDGDGSGRNRRRMMVVFAVGSGSTRRRHSSGRLASGKGDGRAA
jgi:hypothetical protein